MPNPELSITPSEQEKVDLTAQSTLEDVMQPLESSIQLGEFTLSEAVKTQPEDVTSLYLAKNSAGETVVVELLNPAWISDPDCMNGLAAYAKSHGSKTIETNGRFGIVHEGKRPEAVEHLTLDILLAAAESSNEDQSGL